MKEQSEENTKKEVIEKKTIRIFRGHLFIKLVIILLLVLAVIAGIAGLRKGSDSRQSRRARQQGLALKISGRWSRRRLTVRR